MGNRLAFSSVSLTPVVTSVGVIIVEEACGGGGGQGLEAARATILLNSSDGPLRVELSPPGAVTDDVIAAGVE